jgi:hypothetical protein
MQSQALTTQVRGEHFHRGAPVSSEQAVPAVRIKTLFNLALNRVGEFAARALKIACDLAVDLLQSRRDHRINHTPQQPVPRSFCSSGRRDWNYVAMVEEMI